MSSEYYRTPEGRDKKRELNKSRKGAEEFPCPAAPAVETDNNNDTDLESYLKSILSVIEGRAVDEAEIQSLIQAAREGLRQYGLGKDEKDRILPDE